MNQFTPSTALEVYKQEQAQALEKLDAIKEALSQEIPTGKEQDWGYAGSRRTATSF